MLLRNTGADFLNLSVVVVVVVLLKVAVIIPHVNCQLELPAIPGPPYPDPNGQNRWGVKYDPKVHGPPFNSPTGGSKPNKHVQQPPRQPRVIVGPNNNNNKIHNSHPSVFVQPPPASPVGQSGTTSSPLASLQNALSNINPVVPASEVLNVIKAYETPKVIQSSLRNIRQYLSKVQNPNVIVWNLWNSIYNRPNSHNTPVAVQDDINRKTQYYFNKIVKSPLFKNQMDASINQLLTSPTNLQYSFRLQLPSKGKPRRTKFGQARIPKFKRMPKGKRPVFRAKIKRPRRKPRKSQVKIFTTLGKGLDLVTGGANKVRKAVKGTTGYAIASGIKLGGKLVYLGSGVLAKVVKTASKI